MRIPATVKIPTWLKGAAATAILASIGWAFDISQRVSSLEAYVKESINRLDRIERKVDFLREGQ